jgi:hypothetical protein
MQKIPFSLAITGVVSIDEGSISITVNRSETTINFEPQKKEGRILLEKGQTLFDIVLEIAGELVTSTNENLFSAAQLYNMAVERYPSMKRNSWSSHIIAAAGNHPSQRFYGSKRDYFRYLGEGKYSLKDVYVGKTNPSRVNKHQ